MAEYSSGKPEEKKREITLAARWQQLDSKKGDMVRRCEDYAMWTLPYMFPQTGSKHTELVGATDSTGAKAVNHLSNKLIMTLFQPNQPFFRLMASDDMIAEIKDASKEGDDNAKEILEKLDAALVKAEKDAMRELDYTKYRTEATTAAKALIITGNALLYHPEKDGKVQSYGLRDFCIVRDLSGNMVELITRDKKALYTFSKEVQDVLKAANKNKYDKDNCEITIYTQLCLEEDGKFHLKQAADQVPLKSSGTWPVEDLPWIPLTWNLIRGEDYGRGLVEDYAGAFQALYVLNNALVDAVGIAADIKFLVDPGSVIDVKELNDSESGTYHSGKKDDISTFELKKVFDIQLVEAAVDRFQKQIGEAFLLNSAVTRDAERVTAEEIRQNAQELEMAHSGIYSRFAEEWQYRTAVLMLKRVKINIGKGKTVFPQIITGLDSLSRAGDMDNLRVMMSDLAMLKEVPDVFIAEIDPNRYIQYCALRRGVDFDKFLKSNEQKQADADAMQQQNAAAVAADATGKIASAAGQQAMKEE